MNNNVWNQENLRKVQNGVTETGSEENKTNGWMDLFPPTEGNYKI